MRTHQQAPAHPVRTAFGPFFKMRTSGLFCAIVSHAMAVWDAWVLVRHGVSIPSRPHHLSSPACCLTWGVAASGSAAAKCRNSSHCTPQTCSVTCGVGHGTPSLLIACRRPGAFPSAPRVCTGACVQSVAPSATSSVPLARWLHAPTA